METERINDNDELEENLSNFCRANNLSRELFEIARVGKGKGSGDRKVLMGPKSVKNQNCTYVIKLFVEYNIIIIWNYRNNTNMSYPYMTLIERLNNGNCSGDKGMVTHPNNQSRVLFEYTENFERLLNIIADRI